MKIHNENQNEESDSNQKPFYSIQSDLKFMDPFGCEDFLLIMHSKGLVKED